MTGPVLTRASDAVAVEPGRTGLGTESGLAGANPKLFLLNWIANPPIP